MGLHKPRSDQTARRRYDRGKRAHRRKSPASALREEPGSARQVFIWHGRIQLACPYRKFDRTEKARPARDRKEIPRSGESTCRSAESCEGNAASTSRSRSRGSPQPAESMWRGCQDCSRCPSFVAVVQPTDLRQHHDWSHFRRLNRSRLG